MNQEEMHHGESFKSDKVKSRNIAIIIPTLAIGGAERFASLLSSGLTQYGQNVSLILFENKIEYEHSGQIRFAPPPFGKSLIKYILSLPFRALKTRKIKEMDSIDFSVSVMDKANLVNILSKKGDKVIFSVHNYKTSYVGENSFVRFGHKILGKFFYRMADVIVCVSHASASDLIRNFNVPPSKINVIYNPCDPQKIRRDAVSDLSLYKEIFEDPVVITAGTMILQKGQWHLIRAFREVKEKIKNARLVILGDGELRNYLCRLSRNLGFRTFSLGENNPLDSLYDVYFFGFQQNPFNFLSASKVLAMPSLWEGLPYVIVEALAVGLNVISSDCKSGPREILAPDTDPNSHAQDIERAKYGILVPVLDKKFYSETDPLTREETLLAKGIIQLLSDPLLRERYRKAGLKRADDFNTEKIAKQWVDLMEQLT